MKKVGLFLGIILAFVLAVNFVSACSCIAGVSTETRFEDSEVVFIGKVTNIDRPAFSIDSSDPVDVTFDVSKVYKGNLDKSFEVQTPRDSASCGFDFQEEGEYLVYATLNEGKYETNLCSGTNELSNAGEDVQILNTLAGNVDNINDEEKPAPKMDLSQVFVLALLVLVIALLIIAEIHISRWIKGKKKKGK